MVNTRNKLEHEWKHTILYRLGTVVQTAQMIWGICCKHAPALHSLLGQLYTFCILHFAGILQEFSQNTARNTKHSLYIFRTSCEFCILLMLRKNKLPNLLTLHTNVDPGTKWESEKRGMKCEKSKAIFRFSQFANILAYFAISVKPALWWLLVHQSEHNAEKTSSDIFSKSSVLKILWNLLKIFSKILDHYLLKLFPKSRENFLQNFVRIDCFIIIFLTFTSNFRVDYCFLKLFLKINIQTKFHNNRLF